MTITRKLLTLSAISALSFAFAACGDDSGSDDNDTPSTPECTADACDSDGKTLKQCKDGKVTKVDCSTQNKVCSNNKCETASTPTPGTCNAGDKQCADANSYQVCNAEGTWGAAQACETGKTCSKGECSEKGKTNKCNPGKKECNAQGTGFKTCDTNGTWGALESCTGGKICEVATGNCIEKKVSCTANVCEKANTYRECGSDHFLGEEKQCEGEQICDKGGCVDKPADVVIGKDCRCEAEDCHFTITVAELRAALQDKVMTDEFISNIVTQLLPADDVKITAPNYFSSSVTGCDGLTVPPGMAVGCFTTDTIKFDSAYVTLVDKAMGFLPDIIKMATKDKETSIDINSIDTTAIANYVKDILGKGIEFKAQNGYCILADIDINLNVTSQDINDYIKALEQETNALSVQVLSRR